MTIPAFALAQSAIAGVVRDTSGAVLPGVTVEAANPALIEKVKSARSNESSEYRIVDLRPGTYTVSFKLAGFTTIGRPEPSLFNPLNADALLSQVNTFGPALNDAVTILAPRLLRLGLTMRF